MERILPAIRDAARAHQVALADPEATVWSGSSMGGLTALRGVGLYPQHVRAASVCSPSMWWTPDPAASPRDLLRPWNTGETDWVTERLLRSGVDVDLRFSEGGHDHACWRAAWVDDLEALFAE